MAPGRGPALLALLGFCLATTGVVARQLPVTNHVSLFVSATSPYLVFAGLAVTAIMGVVAARRWRSVVVIVLTMAALGASSSTYGPSSNPGSADVAVRIMTANLQLGLAQADAVVAAARRSNADVVALQELTTDAVGRLTEAGINTAFPFHALYPRDGASGAGLWSRYPISSVSLVDGFSMALISARLHVRDGATEPRILVTHLPGPWPQPIGEWRREIARLRAVLERVALDSGDLPVVVVGDFNSTVDMRPFRELLQHGYEDSAEMAGAGRIRTYPRMSLLPPLIGIDHVIVRNGRAASAKVVDLPGSDHLGYAVTFFAVRAPDQYYRFGA